MMRLIIAFALFLSTANSAVTRNVVVLFPNSTAIQDENVEKPIPVRNESAVKNTNALVPDFLRIPKTPGLHAEHGYFIETTRQWDDCSGTVYAVGGMLTGVVNMWWSDRSPRFIPTPTFSTKEDGKTYYSYSRYWYKDRSDVDGYKTDFFSFSNWYEKYYDAEYYYGEAGGVAHYFPTEPVCSLKRENRRGYMPYSYKLSSQGGFSYNRNHLPGSFHHVTDTFSGVYYLYYGSLADCQVGVQPNSFMAYLIKGQCYFDPSSYGFGEYSKVHSWLKVVGYDKKEQTMTYSIHDNDDCEDRDPFKKAEQLTVSLRDYNGIDSNSDCYNHNVEQYWNINSAFSTWVKLRVF